MISLFNKKEATLRLPKLEDITVDCNLPQDLNTQINMIGLTEMDVKRLYALQPIVSTHADYLVKNFYESIKKEPSLVEIINKHSNVDSLSKTLYNHIVEIFSGKVNKEYIAQRQRIAHVHVRIGLGTKWYLNAFQHLMSEIINVLHQELPNKEELYESINSLQKIFSLEQQLVLSAYEIRTDENRQVDLNEKMQIQETMKDTAQELSVIAEETSASLEDLLVQFSNIGTLTDNSNKAIKLVESLSQNGKERMESEKESAEVIQQQITSLHEQINQLYTNSQKIVGVVDVVSSIANQINLLSLNASIESAHAGEHGKGFAVVASEIRNLSKLTKQSTEDIAKLVKEISNQVNGVNTSVKEFNKKNEKNREITEEMMTFFNRIVEAVKESKEKTEVVFKEIKNSEAVVQQISDATTEITRTAETLSM